MTDQPPKWLTMTWTTLATFGGMMVMFGQNYAGWASANPDEAAWLGWSATGIGAVTGVAGMIVAIIAQMKAGSAMPPAPIVDGEAVDNVDHLVSLAVQQATQRGDHDLAKGLIDAIAGHAKAGAP